MKNDFTIEHDRLGGVESFLRVAERRSFRAAAIDLGVSPSAVSQLVKALEARIGVPLLVRTSRSVGLTEAGGTFLERARPGYADIASAYRAAQDRGREPMGTLRITAPRAIYLTMLEPVLAGFHDAFPKVLLEAYAHQSPGAYLFYPGRGHMTPKLRAFIDYLRPHAPARWGI